jgi:hypothetical protein
MLSLNDTLSTDAVTTILLLCFCAAMAAQMSIQCNKRPPIRLLSVLVSFGNTISFINVNDCEGVFGARFVMMGTKIKKGKLPSPFLLKYLSN